LRGSLFEFIIVVITGAISGVLSLDEDTVRGETAAGDAFIRLYVAGDLKMVFVFTSSYDRKIRS
jgi:hypothetical protein